MEEPKNNLHPAPTRLDIIREKVFQYHTKMKWIADFLQKPELQVPDKYKIDKSQEFMEFYIDLESLEAIYKFKDLPKFNRVAVYFGLTAGTNSLTGCFLAIDAGGNVLDNHKPSGGPSRLTDTVPGQDTWLPPSRMSNADLHESDFTLETPWDTIDKHLS